MAVTLGLFEIRKGLWRDALAGVGGIVCAYAASGLLKNLMLDRPYFGEFGYTFNTYPSGHVAVSMLAGIMVVRMLPGSHTRIVAAYGLTACVTLVGISSVTSLAHRPSDVLGGLALSGIIAPWAVRARLPSLRRFSAHLHGPFGAAAAGLISLAALAPFAGVSVGTIAYFTTATLVTTALLVWVSTSECVRPPPHCHPRGRRRPEA
ncbi:phosphatase PAP2 family protein [Microbacterium sp. MPKO10]|uniref:phosphatase PAP2 family protein n=1 Tax=Microbacterium sp. MPKO10 TaxID=2989818 RepID=UPI002235FD08|nr:phosphatase PAP2 family protein [Microbacterium sp. MPKO10]MCW4458854.1 phosphatase PAP2 family protein [Microbacterium sp. MPKO10]